MLRAVYIKSIFYKANKSVLDSLYERSHSVDQKQLIYTKQ